MLTDQEVNLALLSPTEWKVISYEYISDDRNYSVVVSRVAKSIIKKTTDTKTIRLPYKPTVGQILDIPKLL